MHTSKRLVPDYISAKVMRELAKKGACTLAWDADHSTKEESQKNADGSYKFYGRFNQGVATINLVDVACSSYGNMDKFWEMRDLSYHRALRLRHERPLEHLQTLHLSFGAVRSDC